jgi:hypothetical protein
VWLQLKPAGVSQLVQRVLDIEGNAEHWSLKDRCVWGWGVGWGGVQGEWGGGLVRYIVLVKPYIICKWGRKHVCVHGGWLSTDATCALVHQMQVAKGL